MGLFERVQICVKSGGDENEIIRVDNSELNQIKYHD